MIIKELVTILGFKTDARPLEAIGHQLEDIHRKVEFLAAAELVKGLFELAERFGGLGEQLETAAITAGVTVEAFQRLTFAAAQNGVSQDDMTGSLARLSRALYEAKQGSEQSAQAFADAGITPEQLAGFSSAQEAFLALSDSLKNIPDRTKQTAVAMQLLGRSGYTMTKFMLQGSDAINSMGADADNLGATLSETQVEGLAKFEAAMTGLGAVTKGFAATIASAVAPAFTSLVKAAEKLYAANRQMIMLNVKRWLDQLLFGMGFLFGVVEGLTARFLAFAKAHPVLTQAVGKLALVLGALGFVANATVSIFGTLFGVANNLFGLFTKVPLMLFRIAKALPGITRALQELFTVFSGANLLGIGAALTLIVLVAQELWALLHGHKFADTWLGEGLTWLSDRTGLTWMFDQLQNIWRFLGQSLDGTWMGKLINGIGTGAAFLKSTLGYGDQPKQGLAPGQTAPQPTGVLGGLTNLLPNLTGIQMPTLPTTFGPSISQPGPNTTNYTLQAPITVNTGANMTPDQAAGAIEHAIDLHLDRHFRAGMRTVQTGQAG